MVNANEIVMFIIGAGTLLFIYTNRHQLQRLPESNILLSSFYILFISWFFTVCEGFFLEDLLNYLEHIFYAASSILLAIWCWKVFHPKGHISS